MIPTEQAHLNIAAATHPGVKGKLNEDRYGIFAYRFPSTESIPSLLAVLADGIGGHHAGEVAAELAVKHISQYVVQHASGNPAEILPLAFIVANQTILDHAQNDPSLAGMGTTCVCAWIIGSQLYAASIGDSRLYLQRGGHLLRLTTDHTWIQEALARGTLSPAQAKGHPNAHIIRRFLGSSSAFHPDIRLRLDPAESDTQAEANQGLRLSPGERLLLCSDGLTDLLTDAEILEVLRTSSFNLGPTHLINLANLRGGHDNITIVALEVPSAAAITRPTPARPAPQKLPATNVTPAATAWLRVVLLLLAILSAGLLLVYTLVR